MQNLVANMDLKCIKYKIFGAVQGVGFRPFVYTLCNDMGLLGEIYNDSEGVKLTVQGSNLKIDKFEKMLYQSLPPLARIDKLIKQETALCNFKDFKIIKSKYTLKFAPILPDYAICNDCVKEFYDKKDKRYHYVFINCTNCGPRLSIINSLPYDRKNTTMSIFKMCEFCKNEYKNPLNRRYHAEPISCPDCGPVVLLKDINGNIIAKHNEAIVKLANLIKKGCIVAVKGVGGFHIICDARNERSIKKLRQKKYRPKKPFAIMCKNEEMAKELAFINDSEREILNSNIKPIVILKKRANGKIPNILAPNLNKIGIFLPNTGIHLLLFEYINFPIIATSGNISGEPIIYNKNNIEKKLYDVVEFYLDNNREILTPSDDSICFVSDKKAYYLRTSRGINPKIFLSNFKTKGTFLAIGSELKNQFVIYKDSEIFISPYIGDLKNVATFKRFKSLLDMFVKTYDLKFDCIIGDLHPNFAHTLYFEKKGYKVARFQHHYAHLLSVLYEYNILNSKNKFLGFCFDGTGYGDDGVIWGGEVMKFNKEGYERLFHFDEFFLLSGENSIKNIYKIALSLIYKYDLESCSEKFLNKFSQNELKNLKTVYSNEKAVKTTSLGRIFDAFASVICNIDEVSYEGQSGMELEALYINGCEEYYEFEVKEDIIDFKNAFKAIFIDDAKLAATKFINGICEMIIKISKNQKLDIVLSGGVFQNSTLLNVLISKCKKFNIKFYVNSQFPVNDGSIAIGQMAAYLSQNCI